MEMGGKISEGSEILSYLLACWPRFMDADRRFLGERLSPSFSIFAPVPGAPIPSVMQRAR